MIEADPDDVGSLQLRGDAMLVLGHADSALSDYRRADSDFDRIDEAWRLTIAGQAEAALLRAKALESEGRAEDALLEYARAIELHPAAVSC